MARLKGGEKPPKKEDLPGGQQHFPEAEPMPKNPRIHLLARRVKKASKLWSKAAEEHRGLKEELMDAMTENKLKHYEHGDVTVHVDTSRKLKVKIANDDEDADE